MADERRLVLPERAGAKDVVRRAALSTRGGSAAVCVVDRGAQLGAVGKAAWSNTSRPADDEAGIGDGVGVGGRCLSSMLRRTDGARSRAA
jgi:hypothetical protein